MGIVPDDITRVREASDIVAIASEHLALRRVGRRWTGLCPFHAEKSPSFSINAEEGLYYCFGCQAKGDVITFVREVEHLDFVGAVERLAARAGIELHYDDENAGRDRQRKAQLYEAMERAVAWYHERLLTAPDAGAARGYLRSRGYDRTVVEQYRLGWAPAEWDALARALKLPDDVLVETGLGFKNRTGRQTDTFRGRVLFPIFDVQGRPVAFGGRAVAGTEGPKYKNSPETALYHKSRILYGLNWAKADVVTAGEVIVCEGYTDVIGFALAGVPRAVATCGTALADEHFHTLKNFARRVVLAYDADAAGQAAAERFYEWERRYEIDIAVAALPAGKDPADVARDDPDGLRAAVEHARPFLAFRVERVLRAANLATAEGRARAAEAALAVVAEHPNEFLRDQYVMTIADQCRLDPERLRERLRAGPRPDGKRLARAARPAAEDLAAEGPEVEALRLCVHRRAEMLPLLHDVLFGDDLSAAAFTALAAHDTVFDAIEAADPAAAALLQRVAVEETDAEPLDVVALLASRAAHRAVIELEAEQRASDDPLAYAPIVGWLKLRTEELREHETALDASAQLVAWLADRSEEQS